MAGDIYEVWDLESGNCLTAFSTEEEALALVRLNLQEHGPEAVSHWAILRERRGRSSVVAEGDALIQRVSAVADGTVSVRRTG